VHQRLLMLARAAGDDANVILSRYSSERLPYRLAQSPHANQFVLKGAVMFLVWTRNMYRPTMDLDLLGFGEDSVARLAIELSRVLIRHATVADDVPAVLNELDAVVRAQLRGSMVILDALYDIPLVGLRWSPPSSASTPSVMQRRSGSMRRWPFTSFSRTSSPSWIPLPQPSMQRHGSH
jgi:hypothetical protein